MIHFFIGTKAQLIKIAPVMLALQAQGVPYSFVSVGQHRDTMDDILQNFGLRQPDVRVYEGPDITSPLQMLRWGVTIIAKCLWRRSRIFGTHSTNVIVVHGDTFSAVLGALVGRILRFTVVHVESGLRSFDFRNPFPEEMFRVAVFWLADVYYCPTQIEMKNVERFKGEKILTNGNTIVDAARKALAIPDEGGSRERYCVASLHRVENFSSLSSTLRIVELLEIVAQRCKVIFVLHKITEKSLRKFGLFDRIKNNPTIELRPRSDYFSFIQLLRRAQFVVSDGGSNQEECSYMGIPTILFRKATERHDGLDGSVVLSNYDKDVVVSFLSDIERFRKPVSEDRGSPSAIIADHIVGLT